MVSEKKKKVPKKAHDYVFSPKGIKSNFKSIYWTPLRTKRDGKDGVLKKYAKVVCFMLGFAVLFVGIDALVSTIMKGAGFFG